MDGNLQHTEPRDPAKIRADVMAGAALLGVEVHELADGSFLVSKWGLVRPVPDLAAVQALVRQMRGR